MRRPTTATATAAVWGDGGDALLDWLDVPRRHRRPGAGARRACVLLDLPDFDSVETAHRDEVDRVIALADLVVWVADPQKYADGALHDRYLRPLAAHGATMLVVLNQADRLDAPRLRACRADLERLLADDGLPGRRRGVGADRRRGSPSCGAARERVRAREAAVARLAADVRRTRRRARRGLRGQRRAGVDAADRAPLAAALAEAAGVPAVVRRRRAHRRRGALATGWPFVRWVRRLRPDPLRRLRLPERRGAARARRCRRRPTSSARRSLPPPARWPTTPPRTSPEPWPRLVRDAAGRREAELAGPLDPAVAGADLHAAPRWWRGAAAVQSCSRCWRPPALLLLAARPARLPAPRGRVPLPDGAASPCRRAAARRRARRASWRSLARLANGAGAARRARAAAALHPAGRASATSSSSPPSGGARGARRLCAALSAAAPRPGRR